MHDGHIHGSNGLFCLVGSVSLTGLSSKLAKWGWTPETIVSALGAAGMFVMALVQFLKAGWPYFERVMAFLEGRKPPKCDPFKAAPPPLPAEAR